MREWGGEGSTDCDVQQFFNLQCNIHPSGTRVGGYPVGSDTNTAIQTMYLAWERKVWSHGGASKKKMKK